MVARLKEDAEIALTVRSTPAIPPPVLAETPVRTAHGREASGTSTPAMRKQQPAKLPNLRPSGW
jgi:hypothetical protein